MLRFICPACHSVIEASDDKAESKVRCGRCRQLLLVPPAEVAKTTCIEQGPTRTAAAEGRGLCLKVNYLHHTRDRDGDVIFYFSDPLKRGEGGVLSSSPIKGMRRVLSGVVDVGGGRTRYVLRTQNHEYEVHMTSEKASHLAMELGVALPE